MNLGGSLEQYNKFNIALEYLDVASNLFLSGHNYFSCLHLAGAAEDIIGKYCSSVEIKSEFIKYKESAIAWQSKVDPSLSVKDALNNFNYPKNTIKHFDLNRENDAQVTLNIKYEAESMLRRAYNNLENLDMLECTPSSLVKVIELTTIWIESDS